MPAFDPLSYNPFGPVTLPTSAVPTSTLSEQQRQAAIAAGYQDVGGYLVPPLSRPAGSPPPSGASPSPAASAPTAPATTSPASPPPGGFIGNLYDAASGAFGSAASLLNGMPVSNPLVPPTAATALAAAAAAGRPASGSDSLEAMLADGRISLADYSAAMDQRDNPFGEPASSTTPPSPVVAPDSDAAAAGAGPQDVPNSGPGTPGYTGNPPPSDPGPPGFRDTDGNGIDDREQTTVGPTSFGLPYGQMQGMPTLPTGWGSAINTGMGGFIPADGGGGASLGGYGGDIGGYPSSGAGGAAGGPASGGNFNVPGGSGGFTPSAPPSVTLPDVSQIGANAGGSTGGGMTFPSFQNPLSGTGTTGSTGTTGASTGGSGGVTTTGSPTGSSGLVQNLAGSYQGAIDSANAANENRFASGLELLLKRAEQAGQAIQGLNYEGMNDIGRMFGQQRARADQDLINRGLANTTVREGVMRGYATDEQAARNRYADEQVRANINENYRQQGDLANWIGARNDVGPDMGQLANLASGVGAAGTGSTSVSPATGTSQSQQNLPAPSGNVINNPTNAAGQRVDISANGQTQSVGGQQLSGPGQSSSGTLTRSAPSSSSSTSQPSQSTPSQPSAEQLWANSGWAQNANNLVRSYVSGSAGGQRPEFSDPLGQAANLGNQQNANNVTQQNQASAAAAAQQQASFNPQTSETIPLLDNVGSVRGQVSRSQIDPSSTTYGNFRLDPQYLATSGSSTPSASPSSSEPLSAGSNSGVSTGQRTGGTLQTGPMNAPPPSGGAISLQNYLSGNRSASDSPSTGIGVAASQPMSGMFTGERVGGTLQTGPIGAPPPGMAPPRIPGLGPVNPNKIAGAPPAAAPASGSQSLLGIMGNYGSSSSGATPPSQLPASPLTGSPARALVDNNQPMASAGQAPAPFSPESLYAALPQNAALWGNPTGPMNPMVMQNGQMTPATFLPSLGRYGVLA